MRPVIKRVLKTVAVVLFVVVAFFALAIGQAFRGNAPIEDGRELGERVRVVKDGYVTMGMIDVGGGKIALVDAGNDATGQALLAELGRRKLGPEAVVAVLLTHGHPDHIAAWRLFPGAAVYALAAEVDLAEGRVAAHSPVGVLLGKQPGTKITRVIADGETLSIGDRTVKVFAVPGHTAGSAAFLVDGALFLGDSASATSDGKIKGAPWFFSDDCPQNRASLHALAERLRPTEAEVKFLVPSHTGVLPGLGQLLAFKP
jgi:hydroxyacylglutathione hydrolase